jgi:transcriptional regulator with PAS, ATPase and Fis domain
MIRQGKRVALTNYNVLITGESGTGKELMAQAIHNASNRSHMPFIAINCGALPRGLIVSELFGYDGGSFTGSKKEGNPGKFELADGGTIFLDEIGDMPLDVQVTLLRVIQEKEVIRIGGSKPKKTDVRIIAATNKNLEEEVLNKTFRRDLFYRLNVLAINMPSLRNRQEDLELLINNILERIISETNKPHLTIDGPAMNLLKSYDWPGNIRELENVLERAANNNENFIISYHDLPLNFPQGDIKESPDIPIIERKQMDLIMDTLRETHGNIKQTAEKLGIARNTIYRKMEKYNIPSDFGKN